jgi:hypothetical protein
MYELGRLVTPEVVKVGLVLVLDSQPTAHVLDYFGHAHGRGLFLVDDFEQHANFKFTIQSVRNLFDY